MTSYDIGPLWESTVEKPCVLCGTATSTNIMSSHPMCAACHRRAEAVVADLHAQELARMEAKHAEDYDRIRDGRRVDVARLGFMPPRWRPLARSIWTTRRFEINVKWIHAAIMTVPSAHLDTAAFRAFADELREMEEIGSELPIAQLLEGAHR